MANTWNTKTFEKIHEINESRRNLEFTVLDDPIHILTNKSLTLAFADNESAELYQSRLSASEYLHKSLLHVLKVVKPVEELYYVQDTRQYIGNCMLFWRLNGNGYTTDLEDAAEFTYDEAKRICDMRDTDKMWKVSELRAKAGTTVDMQKVGRQ